MAQPTQVAHSIILWSSEEGCLEVIYHLLAVVCSLHAALPESPRLKNGNSMMKIINVASGHIGIRLAL